MKKVNLSWFGAFLFFSTLLFAACKKDHPGETYTATGTLHDWKGNCLPDIAHGAWYVGLTPGDSNYVEVGIYVEKMGTYRIATDRQNGVQFADSGSFIATGYQSVRLKPAGAFIHPGTTDFSISFGHTICGFSINVDTVPVVTINRWKFTAGGHTYEGPATGNLLVYTDGSGGEFDINGHVDNSTDTAISIGLRMPPHVDTVLPGIYPTGDPATNNYFFLEPSHTSVIYRANPLLADKVLLTIRIAGFTTAPGGGRQVIGTFSGTALEDATGEPVEIRDGTFSVAQ